MDSVLQPQPLTCSTQLALLICVLCKGTRLKLQDLSCSLKLCPCLLTSSINLGKRVHFLYPQFIELSVEGLRGNCCKGLGFYIHKHLHLWSQLVPPALDTPLQLCSKELSHPLSPCAQALRDGGSRLWIDLWDHAGGGRIHWSPVISQEVHHPLPVVQRASLQTGTLPS